MAKRRFKVIPIRGKNSVVSNKRCRLRYQDMVCWVNATQKDWKVRFTKSPLARGKSFTVKAGNATKWYSMKRLPRNSRYGYVITDPSGGGGPGGPEIISDGG